MSELFRFTSKIKINVYRGCWNGCWDFYQSLPHTDIQAWIEDGLLPCTVVAPSICSCQCDTGLIQTDHSRIGHSQINQNGKCKLMYRVTQKMYTHLSSITHSEINIWPFKYQKNRWYLIIYWFFLSELRHLCYLCSPVCAYISYFKVFDLLDKLHFLCVVTRLEKVFCLHNKI